MILNIMITVAIGDREGLCRPPNTVKLTGNPGAQRPAHLILTGGHIVELVVRPGRKRRRFAQILNPHPAKCEGDVRPTCVALLSNDRSCVAPAEAELYRLRTQMLGDAADQKTPSQSES